MTATSGYAAGLTVEYDLIARSGSTTVPGSSSAFNGFGAAPAIDEDGNVVFTGGGGGRAGVYTALGYCCQIVADTQTPIPGGGGATFYDFSGDERHDIDNGRVAFTGLVSAYQSAVFSNVGQSSATTLRRIAAEDGVAWQELGDPWVDGNTVAVYGMRPSQDYAVLEWDGASQSTSYLNPGAGFNTAYNTQASISDDAAVFLRYNSNAYQVAVAMGSTYESLATAGVTPMPGMNDVFDNFYHHPVVDRSGMDVAFLGYGTFQGLFKRVDGGALQHVADNSMYVPGSSYERITLIDKMGIALANGQVVFQASTSYLEQGIYTDIGGELAILLDTGNNDTIVVNGQSLRVAALSLGTRSFAYGPDGYMVVFRANLATGGMAIIRATVTEGSGGVDGTFTVRKDYSDNNSDSVSVTATCSSGSVTNNPQWAREGVPAVFQVTGAAPGTTCTAVETSVAVGYTKNESDCQDGDPLNGSCTLVNTLIPPSSNTFTVYKDFSDNNSASVGVTLSCTSGTVTNNPQSAREGVPAVFQISGATAGATCTAVESSVPSGYTKNESGCQDGDPLNGSCTLVNTLIPPASNSITVRKDFSDNNSAWVSVSLACTSGTVTNSPLWAREGTPAVFNVSGASAGAKCTAVETALPSGYTKDESGCQNVALDGSCTLVNTLIPPTVHSFTVFKDFSDNNSASVGVTLSCTSGTVTNNPQTASELTPAVFSISGAAAGTTCTAVESSAPSGYTKNETGCQDGDPLNGSCTLVNTLNPPSTTAQFTVFKDFSDNNTAWVYVKLICTSGTVTNSPRWGREGTPIVFDIENAAAGATCTAEELRWPDGYSKNESDCQNGDPLNGSCTLVNTLGGTTSNGQFTVYKDFSDNYTGSVSVSLSCSSGSVTNNPQLASESAPAVFNVSGASAGTTCTAVENSVPSGYTKNETGCQDGDPLNGSCTIVNTKNPPATHSFTVYKDFSDNSAASVSVSLTCTSGTVTNNPRLASEGSPAVFTISGASAGATCTAVENVVPQGYAANQSDCQNGDPLNGSCTIVNTLNAPDPDDIISTSGFESGQAEGWSLSGGAKIDSSNAMGNYSLMLENGGASALRGVSTTGFTDVSVTLHIAAESLEKNDFCYAELSTNGGGSWSPIATLESGDRRFYSATVSPAAASNNANLRLRYRLVGKGKGDYCWGDDIIVRGRPVGGGAPSALPAGAGSLDVVLSDPIVARADTAPPINAFARRGFDPGYDQLIGDGAVRRTALRYEQLVGAAALPRGIGWSAFDVPPGAAQPEYAFEGSLHLQAADGSRLGAVPTFDVEFVQIGNHLLPQGQVSSNDGNAGWAYTVDTGRVWQENGDHGYSRAAVPLLLHQAGTGCVRNGIVTFLFDDRGAASAAAMRLGASDCAPGATGLMQAAYVPASVGNAAVNIEEALDCAANSWLPAVQGRGGITLMLLPDNSLQYVFSDRGNDLWLEAGPQGGAAEQWCD